ncbi:hypothetical protein DES53_104195 [Roseimicrobium gellanilyticum]|uniref:Trm112 family protein n=1 Tax=Roseimicrobium gellanilyticum TaxID=748857 RepID=A0A366HP70_9BACT|nr:hypothetical protein [Roseimicrobium gellanilyticum]RBP44375.1 hypothetical protein DES53_104195 [Roseimicrobium gellanilyticum]
MPTPPEVLALLRCPATKQPLRAATAEEKKAHGIPESEDALVSQDGTHIYGSPDGLPRLLSAKEVTPEDEG